MFNAFSNIMIFRRLAIVFAVATLIPIMVILLLSNFSLRSSETRSAAVHTSFDAQNIATQQQINLQRMNALLQARFAQVFSQGGNLALAGDPSSGKLTQNDVDALEKQFQTALNNYRSNYEIATSDNMNTIRDILVSDAADHGKHVITLQQQALDDVAKTDWPNYQTRVHKLLQDLETNTFYQVAYADFYQSVLGFLELKNVWQNVVDTATQMGTTVTQTGPSITNPLLIYTSLALISTLLVLILSGFLVNVTIVSPLNRLVALTKRVAQGDTGARATIIGRDEINQVANSMNGMLDNILHLMQDAQRRHAELQAQIQQMSNEVSGVGEGNLQVQLHVTSDDLGMLADTFNVMAEELNSLVAKVKILARGVQNAALQAFGYMEQLIDNADGQIQQITQAAGDVGHVAVSSRKIAERAQILNSVALEARNTAHKGRSGILQAINGMTRINENVTSTSKKVLSLGDRSREISNIVTVISNIAQQTNRLALDASIQAAMAGEHGQGFGAVAIDIRRLAERAKEQSALVTQIVRNVLEDINSTSDSIQETARETLSGTQVVQEVGNVLEVMFSTVERQASEIDATNQVATQQLQSANRVVQIMQSASDGVRRSSIITGNVAQQVERLAPLAGQLLASVDVFKLREDRSPYVMVSEIKASPAQGQLAFNNPMLSPAQSGQSTNRGRETPPPRDYPGQNFTNPNVPYQPSGRREMPPLSERLRK